MLFNSYLFIFFFLPITLVGYFFLTHKKYYRISLVWLVLASLCFYGWWKASYVLLIACSILFNFIIGSVFSWKLLTSPIYNKILLTFGVMGNLGLLAYFKYANFLVDNVNSLFHADFTLPNIILPIAISFFTFEQIAYLVDAYRGQTPHYSFLDYCFFVTFFPRLIAGPIVRHYEILPQIHDKKTFQFSYENLSVGFTTFFVGLFKKVILANAMASYADPLFGSTLNGATSWSVWLGVLAYTLQIYFDFSGYSDMAIGLARLFGITLPMNFNSPYQASSIIDFWRQWHMTLSRFLRDYLYFSLGGGRCGRFRRYLNLMLTMVIGGLWHGANWTFMMWGGLHGLYLMVNHAWRNMQRSLPQVFLSAFNYKNIFPRMLTFLVVTVAWVFFRSATFHEAFMILKAMINMSPLSELRHVRRESCEVGLLLLFVWFFPNTQEVMGKTTPVLEYSDPAEVPAKEIVTWSATKIWACVTACIAVVGIIHLGNNVPFIYFDF